MKHNTTTTTANGETRNLVMFDNDASRKGKESVKSYFRDYEKQLTALWDGLKAEDTAFKALNAVIAGIAGGEGMKPAVWLVTYFSRYIDANGAPCNRRKDEDGKPYFVRATLSGQYARGILQRAALNAIESNRIGNRFAQEIVNPREK